MPAPYLQEFYSAARAAIGTVWDDVIPNGIWEDMQIEDVPLGDLPGPPYAVLQLDLEDAEWGGSNETYEGDLLIWRIDKSDQPGYVQRDRMTFLRDNLEALRDYLLNNEISSGQVLEVTRVAWDVRLEANQFFKATQRAAVAGVVVARVLVGNAAE